MNLNIRNCTSSFIFFAYWDRRRLPAGRQGRPKRPIINLAPILFLSLLPTGKVAGDHIYEYWFNSCQMSRQKQAYLDI
jgi:hypothetical protein